MQYNIKNVLAVVAIAAVAGYSMGAMAEKGGKGRGHDGRDHMEMRGDDHRGDHTGKERHHSRHDDGHHGDKARLRLVFGDDDRGIVHEYLRRHYGKSCPPGLAKKRNGCLPPGQAKKLYRVGYPLDVDWHPLPDVLLERLHPAPAGYQYVMVDRDVLLIGEASKKVIDAITLLSAVQ